MRHFAKQSSGSNSGPDLGELHGGMMTIAWIFLAHLGLWSQFFKSSLIFLKLHTFLMSVVVILTAISGFQAIVTFGLKNDMPVLHNVLGIIIILFVLLVAGGGVLCYTLRTVPKLKSSLVVLAQKIHRYSGWFLLIASWVQMFTSKQGKSQIAIIIFGLISFGLFLLFKLFLKKKMQKKVLTEGFHNGPQQKLRQIKTANDLSVYNGDYFIYADKIYDIDSVLSNHPGGWEIAKAIKGRQVDRYLYGTQPIQTSLQSITVNNHFAQSIHLAGAPIAQLYNPSPYRNLQQQNPAGVEQLTKPCKNNIMYCVYLLSKQKPFEYQGYTELSQLGKYWTLGIDKKILRLYSVVNYLNLFNLEFMEKVANKIFWENNKVIYYNGAVQQIVMKQRQKKQPYIPLFIKKYDKGIFTNQFLSGKFTNQVDISRPMGRGLALHQINSGIVLMLAAGTGLNPYCDLIDLLFKQTLLLQTHPLSTQIIKQNSILQNRPFTPYQFIIYISVNQITQIHPITLYQINYLGQRNRLKSYIISKDQTNTLYSQYPTLIRIKGRTQNLMIQWLKFGDQVQRIYICGSPQYSQCIVKQLIRMNVQPYKYKIL